MDTDNYEQETDGEEGRVSSTLPNRPRRALTIPLTDKDTEVIRVTFERDKPKEPDQSGFIRTLWQRKQSQKKAWIKAPVVHRVPQETYNQKQSPLFQLPFDIRLMIWKEGLAGCRWHIGLSDLKLKGCECNGRHTRTEIISYERRRDMDGVSIPSVLEPADRIPVLLTCRMIYSETARVLYRDSIFDFYDSNIMGIFLRSIPLSRFNSIRTLKLAQCFNENMSKKDTYKQSFINYRRWEEVCSMLAAMQGLENLCLFLRGWLLQGGTDVDAIFHPLAKITARTMTVWLAYDAKWEVGDIPTELSGRSGFRIRHMSYCKLETDRYGIITCRPEDFGGY